MKTIEISFRPTQLLDPRKNGSALEIGQILTGSMQLSNSCVSWEDVNGQQWAFWIGDTAELVEIKSDGENAQLYRSFLNLKENHDYWGLCIEADIKDFCQRNNLNFDVFTTEKEIKNNISKVEIIDKNLKSEIISILNYFENGLSDIEEGSGENQPMLKEIRNTLKKLNQ